MIADNAINAGIGAKNTALILNIIDEQFTKIDLSQKNNVELIFNTISMHYANTEASK